MKDFALYICILKNKAKFTWTMFYKLRILPNHNIIIIHSNARDSLTEHHFPFIVISKVGGGCPASLRNNRNTRCSSWYWYSKTRLQMIASWFQGITIRTASRPVSCQERMLDWLNTNHSPWDREIHIHEVSRIYPHK